MKKKKSIIVMSPSQPPSRSPSQRNTPRVSDAFLTELDHSTTIESTTRRKGLISLQGDDDDLTVDGDLSYVADNDSHTIDTKLSYRSKMNTINTVLSELTLPGGLKQRRVPTLSNDEVDHAMQHSDVQTSMSDFMAPQHMLLEERLLGMPGDLQLSPAITKKYFGARARHNFMMRTQFIRRQRQITNKNPSESTNTLYYDNEKSDDNEAQAFSPLQRGRKGTKGSVGSHYSSNRSVSTLSTLTTAKSSPSLSPLPKRDIGANRSYNDNSNDRIPLPEIGSNNQNSGNGVEDDVGSVSSFGTRDESLYYQHHRHSGNSRNPRGYDDDDDDSLADELDFFDDMNDGCSYKENDDEDDENFDDDLTLKSHLLLSEGMDLAISSPMSPRTTYIAGCIRERLNPRASLIVRKRLTKKMDLQHLGFGDKMGALLAESIALMPFLQSINVADNNLTDDGLGPILQAAVQVKGLLEINMSQNEIGTIAAEAMGNYLESPTCTLERLILKNADVDDFEGERFITALKKNTTVKEIDLSNNKLGIAENLNTVMPDITTAGEALADLLSTSTCSLQTLKLAWNMIRLDGAIALASSLSANTSLTYLDLSYNALGKGGGMALGNSLIDNRSLRTLLLATNSIEAVGCFTLSIGVLENENLEYLNLDGNAIGEQGARALMMIPTIVGSRVKISASKCNVSLKDSGCYFDFDNLLHEYNLDLSNHFERAIALLLLHLVSAHHTYVFSRFDYVPTKTGGGGGGTESLNLTAFLDSSKMQYFDENQRRVEHGLRVVMDACSNVENAIKLFEKIDVDGSGELERDEFARLLANMGIMLDEVRLNECFDTYDTDQGGTLGVAEFMVFLKKTSQDTALRLRDLTTTPAYGLAPNPTVRYLPPNDGTLHLEIVDGFTRKEVYRTMTSVDRDNIDSVAASTGDATKMTAYGVSTAKIRLDEAYALYLTMMKERPNKTNILATLLPQLGSAQDARMLVSKALKGNKTDMMQLRRTLGSAVRPMLGIVNGYFSLDLSKSLDRLCLVRLLEASKTRAHVRARASKLPMGRVADLSHRMTNNSCFRNEIFNGKPVIITSAFCNPMPKYGVLSFDFSGGERPLSDDVIAADGRIAKALMQCFLMKESELEAAEEKLERYKLLSDSTINGDAKTLHEATWQRCKAIGDAQHDFYANLSCRVAEQAQSAENEDIKVKFAGAGDKLTDDSIVAMTRGSDVSMNKDFCHCPGSFKLPARRRQKPKATADTVAQNNNNSGSDDNVNKNNGKIEDIKQNAEEEEDSSSDEDENENEEKEEIEKDGIQTENNADKEAENISSSNDETERKVETEGNEGEGESEEKGNASLQTVVNNGDESDSLGNGENLAGTESNSSNNSNDNSNDNDVAVNTEVEVDVFSERFRNMLACVSVKPQAKAVRILEILDETFSKLWLRSRHLALMCECFKQYGELQKTKHFGSYRVELVVSLFERIVDVHNLDLVLRVLEPLEVGCLYCRLGWLALYNPMKPEGGMSLDMSIWEERVVAKTIVVLATDEPGDNLTRAEFSWDRYGDPVPGWEMTIGWCKEDGMPTKGILTVIYYSGEGKLLNGCIPNIPLRRALLQLVYLEENDILTDEQWEEKAKEEAAAVEAAAAAAIEKGKGKGKEKGNGASGNAQSGSGSGGERGNEDDGDTIGIRNMKSNIGLWTNYLVPPAGTFGPPKKF